MHSLRALMRLRARGVNYYANMAAHERGSVLAHTHRARRFTYVIFLYSVPLSFPSRNLSNDVSIKYNFRCENYSISFRKIVRPRRNIPSFPHDRTWLHFDIAEFSPAIAFLLRESWTFLIEKFRKSRAKIRKILDENC